MRMKIATRAIALVTIVISAVSSTSIADAAGRSATAAVNTILNGKGAPKSSLGINGDFYIDTRSLLLYGPKTKGKWPTPKSIQGPTGPSGSDGKNGSDGKSASTSNINSVSGPQGIQGEKGEKGEAGLPGSPGAIGPAGPAGASGPAGPPGASGSNGAQGAAGATGATGSPGAQGIAGAKGETGTVGPSEVSVLNIDSWTLNSSTHFSFANSLAFGELNAHSSYSFYIQLRGQSVFNDFILGLDVLSPGNEVIFSYSHNHSVYATYSASAPSYTFDVIGVIRTASLKASLQLRVIDAVGDSGPYPMTLSGKAYITLVGSIK